jgi:nitrite reductase/ring-hydroxylating ferredoxin subunit/Fe-S cluster biogenesis protein NfuA
VKDDMSESVEAGSEPSLEDLLRAVDVARDRVRHADKPAQELAEQLQTATDAFTKKALVTLIRSLRENEVGKQLLVEAAKQPDVAALLTVHGIIRGGREREVLAVLEAMRPHLAKAGAGASLDRLDGDVVVLRLSGNAVGSGAGELQQGIERTLREHIPWMSTARVAPEPTLIGGALLTMPKPWVDGPTFDEVPNDRTLQVAVGDDVGIVLVRVGAEVRGYRNQCGHQGLPLDHALVEDGELQCSWHGYRYDALSGDGLTDPGCTLEPIDVRVVDGRVQVRT